MNVQTLTYLGNDKIIEKTTTTKQQKEKNNNKKLQQQQQQKKKKKKKEKKKYFGSHLALHLGFLDALNDVKPTEMGLLLYIRKNIFETFLVWNISNICAKYTNCKCSMFS